MKEVRLAEQKLLGKYHLYSLRQELVRLRQKRKAAFQLRIRVEGSKSYWKRLRGAL